MITKREAFDKVMEKWVMGDCEFAMMPDSTFCTYNKTINGGCAIGQYLPDGHPSQTFEGTVRALFTQHPDIRDMFEPGLDFWTSLQTVHDKLGAISRNEGIKGKSESWKMFQEALKYCAENC